MQHPSAISANPHSSLPTSQPTSSNSSAATSSGRIATTANPQQRYRYEGFQPFRIGSLTGRLAQRGDIAEKQQRLQPTIGDRKEPEAENHSLYPKKSDGVRPRTNFRFMNESLAKQLSASDRDKLFLAFETLIRNLPDIAQAEMWKPKKAVGQQPIIPLSATFTSISEVYLKNKASLNVSLRDFIHYFIREYFTSASKHCLEVGNIYDVSATHRDTSDIVRPSAEIGLALNAVIFSCDKGTSIDLPLQVRHHWENWKATNKGSDHITNKNSPLKIAALCLEAIRNFGIESEDANFNDDVDNLLDTKRWNRFSLEYIKQYKDTYNHLANCSEWKASRNNRSTIYVQIALQETVVRKFVEVRDFDEMADAIAEVLKRNIHVDMLAFLKKLGETYSSNGDEISKTTTIRNMLKHLPLSHLQRVLSQLPIPQLKYLLQLEDEEELWDFAFDEERIRNSLSKEEYAELNEAREEYEKLRDRCRELSWELNKKNARPGEDIEQDLFHINQKIEKSTNDLKKRLSDLGLTLTAHIKEILKTRESTSTITIENIPAEPFYQTSKE